METTTTRWDDADIDDECEKHNRAETIVNYALESGKDVVVADVGCGNGKNLPEVESLGGKGVGCDFSIGLLEICAVERGLEVFAGDAVCLPLRSKSFDVALNIAVLHHISSEVRRRKLVTETMRLLTVNGVALFYAWALEQEEAPPQVPP